MGSSVLGVTRMLNHSTCCLLRLAAHTQCSGDDGTPSTGWTGPTCWWAVLVQTQDWVCGGWEGPGSRAGPSHPVVPGREAGGPGNERHRGSKREPKPSFCKEPAPTLVAFIHPFIHKHRTLMTYPPLKGPAPPCCLRQVSDMNSGGHLQTMAVGIWAPLHLSWGASVCPSPFTLPLVSLCVQASGVHVIVPGQSARSRVCDSRWPPACQAVCWTPQLSPSSIPHTAPCHRRVQAQRSRCPTYRHAPAK